MGMQDSTGAWIPGGGDHWGLRFYQFTTEILENVLFNFSTLVVQEELVEELEIHAKCQ